MGVDDHLPLDDSHAHLLVQKIIFSIKKALEHYPLSRVELL